MIQTSYSAGICYHIPIDKMARAPPSDEEVKRALSVLCNGSPVSAEIQRTLDAEAQQAPEGQEDAQSFYGYELGQCKARPF